VIPDVEDTLLGGFSLLEVIAIVLFWVAGEDAIIYPTIGGIDPSTQGTSVDVWS
jgi:hypothetical protein